MLNVKKVNPKEVYRIIEALKERGFIRSVSEGCTTYTKNMLTGIVDVTFEDDNDIIEVRGFNRVDSRVANLKSYNKFYAGTVEFDVEDIISLIEYLDDSYSHDDEYEDCKETEKKRNKIIADFLGYDLEENIDTEEKEDEDVESHDRCKNCCKKESSKESSKTTKESPNFFCKDDVIEFFDFLESIRNL